VFSAEEIEHGDPDKKSRIFAGFSTYFRQVLKKYGTLLTQCFWAKHCQSLDDQLLFYLFIMNW
jgi:hypothetical protein